MEILTENSVAVIVAIESYQFSGGRIGMNPVDYAENDAKDFKNLLINENEI